MSPPRHVIHADWGTHPSKRWAASADNTGPGWRVSALRQVPAPGVFVGELVTAAEGGAVVAGFDFPIGLPAAYAGRAEIDDFRALLPLFGDGDWAEFFTPCETAGEIAMRRPFYPHRPGGTRRQHLIDALGLSEPYELLRRCEWAQADRPAAASLLWTLGAKQVGKAAIGGWRDVIQPLLRVAPDRVQLWPFDGPFAELGARTGVTICETYPRNAYTTLGFPMRGWSKRNPADRVARGRQVLAGLDAQSITLSDAAEHQMRTGFGARPDGEDPFDAFVGLLGTIATIDAGTADNLPNDSRLSVEGWILGQDAERERPPPPGPV